MKQLIALFLMVTIQITFMQKVIASMPLLESHHATVEHCEMMKLSPDDCDMKSMTTSMKAVMTMDNCQSDCEMMSVVSINHFIEYDHILSFVTTQINYPFIKISTINSLPKSLFRPPLLS